MVKYKIGDRVRIPVDIIERRNAHNLGNNPISSHAGKVLTVSDVVATAHKGNTVKLIMFKGNRCVGLFDFLLDGPVNNKLRLW